MISLPGLGYRFGARRALLLGARQIAVYHWQDNAAIRHSVFAADEAGRQGFRRYLADTPDVPFCALVDLVDEEYRHDTVPRLSRRDRRALLERKAGRLFKDTGYWSCQVTGRETGGRRDHRVLLSALATPSVISRWVGLLDEARTPLAGICSLPLFTGQLLNELAGGNAGRRLLVSLQSVSGLRQTCFDNGGFQYSRLALTPRNERELGAETICSEVEKVRRYLNSQRPHTPAEPLQVHFLLGGALLPALQSALTRQQTVSYHFCDLDELVGAPAPAATPFSDRYFMQRLFRLRPGNTYARAAQRRYFFLRRLRATVVASGVAFLSGSAGSSALGLLDGLALARDSHAAREQALSRTAEYELARSRLPQTPVAPSDLKTAVVVAQRVAQQRPTPLRLVSVVSRSLDGFPAIRLRRLAWTVTGDPDATGSLAARRAAVPVAPAVYQVALLDGRVEPFNGNFREAMELVNRFAESLRGQQAVSRVRIVALPLDLSSDAALQGNTRSPQRQVEFTLRLALENRHGA